MSTEYSLELEKTDTAPMNGLRESRLRKDWAYILPMAAFLVFTWIGAEWPSTYFAVYPIKTIVVGILLALLWRNYTPIRWNYAWLGVLAGVVGVAQWVLMEKLIPGYPRQAHIVFDPEKEIVSGDLRWAFITVRWAGASLLVPVMEELFWRDYLWRTLMAPHDFAKARIGAWDWKTLVMVAVVFGAGVHVEWPTAIVWGFLIGWLLIYTRSLGACIIAHGMTNFLLGLYVLISKDWRFW
jgi:hypothetical protein